MIVAGEEWERQCDVPKHVPGLPASTVRVWASAGRVRSVKVGGSVWVAVEDVLAAAAAARHDTRATRRLIDSAAWQL